ncbi:squalene/phytoene synthase family protein [Aurantiacibacter poecillastricola]|uniref:squalene/phytoene synthase family protein n=1 Tax=Aurantiacibacter poecillastricola TaxID=3064385 RepID=UPI00273D60D9|nr:squalene/phytoene synthase family protein [Aurantiacibacter sp. 219JJ12-13]MDP5262072.1 squalene/phytoene synthase family protein [Aurantiacibacter sp. 219JJ12-13]
MTADLIETLPLPQRLALSYAPRRNRDNVLALLALNARLSGIVRQQGEPVIAQMKLAWWRDRFAQDTSEWPVGEPLLALLSRYEGATEMLGSLVDGWEGLLSETLGRQEIEGFAGGHADAWSGMLNFSDKCGEEEAVRRAAEQWSLADLAMNLSDERERALTLERVRSIGQDQGRLPRSARSLTVLRGLALRALERGSSDLLDGPGAMAMALRLGVVGR